MSSSGPGVFIKRMYSNQILVLLSIQCTMISKTIMNSEGIHTLNLINFFMCTEWTVRDFSCSNFALAQC